MDTAKISPENRGSNPEPLFSIRFGDIWRGVVKFWWVCLILGILFAGILFYHSYVRFTPVYQCEASFTVNTREHMDLTGGVSSTAYYYNRVTADMLSTTFPNILQSDILQELICRELGTAAMPGTITASALAGTNLFTLTAKAADAQVSYDLLMAVIENYPSVAEYVIGDTELNMLSPPQVPAEPINQYAYRAQIAKGFMAGLLVGCAWILLYATQRSTIRSRKDIRQLLRQNCVGILPYVVFKKHKKEINRTVFFENQFIGSGFLESLRGLRSSVLHGLQENEKIIMITSTAPGEGKTTVTVNLAASIAAMHKNVLLIDADLRNPSVKARLEDSVEGGFIPVTEAEVYIPKHAVLEKLPGRSLSLITFEGDKKLWSTLNHNWLQKWLNQFRNQFDYIIIDTPPCGIITDPAILADVADVILYVVDQDAVRVSRIKNAIESISGKKARFMGCILNGAASDIGGYGENYGYSRYFHKYGRYGGHYGYGKYSSDQNA